MMMARTITTWKCAVYILPSVWQKPAPKRKLITNRFGLFMSFFNTLDYVCFL